MAELDPRRRKQAFVSLAICSVLCAALAVMYALEPGLFADRAWDLGRVVTVAGFVLAASVFGRLAWFFRG
jgi:hypothetical protein